MKARLAGAALLALNAAPAFAHRLDEYLQGTLISIEKNRAAVQITLTPGVAVFHALIMEVDTNADGVISTSEQQAYAKRVLGDVSLKIDGRPSMPRFLSAEFPAIEEMKEGRGEIRIEFDANLPPGGPERKLLFTNHHQSGISVYQVNALVPRDRDVRILAQNRNESQSLYEVEFTQTGARNGVLSSSWEPSIRKQPLGAVVVLCLAWLALLRGQWSRLVKREPAKRERTSMAGLR